MFSRNTIIKLVESLPFQYHAEVDQFALEFALEDVIIGSTIKEKKTSLMMHLIKNPQETSPDGIPLSQAIIGHLISKYGGSSEPSETFPDLVNSLDRDGYFLDRNGFRTKLIKTIDKANQISEAKNETIEIDSQADINKAQLKVFLCHAKEDKQDVGEQYSRLKNDGFMPWIDDENLLPGQDWDLEVRRAVRESDVVLVFLSNNSVTKTGYVQKEIRLAIDVAEEQPEGTIFIIPVRLENCEVPDRLKKLHWVDLFNENGYPRLILALKRRQSELYPPRQGVEEGDDIRARIRKESKVSGTTIR